MPHHDALSAHPPLNTPGIPTLDPASETSPLKAYLEEVVQVPHHDALEVRDIAVAEQNGDGGECKGQVEGFDGDEAV